MTDAALRAWLEQWQPPASFQMAPHVYVTDGARVKARTLADWEKRGQVRIAAVAKARKLYELFGVER